jgi:hypothetical protein
VRRGIFDPPLEQQDQALRCAGASAPESGTAERGEAPAVGAARLATACGPDPPHSARYSRRRGGRSTLRTPRRGGGPAPRGPGAGRPPGGGGWAPPSRELSGGPRPSRATASAAVPCSCSAGPPSAKPSSSSWCAPRHHQAPQAPHPPCLDVRSRRPYTAMLLPPGEESPVLRRFRLAVPLLLLPGGPLRNRAGGPQSAGGEPEPARGAVSSMRRLPIDGASLGASASRRL